MIFYRIGATINRQRWENDVSFDFLSRKKSIWELVFVTATAIKELILVLNYK